MTAQSMLYLTRHSTLPKANREQVLACERTAHELTLQIATEADEALPHDQARTAAIVGIFTGLCRLIAENSDIPGLPMALAQMLPHEVAAWGVSDGL
jgi:hypothetical protein